MEAFPFNITDKQTGLYIQIVIFFTQLDWTHQGKRESRDSHPPHIAPPFGLGTGSVGESGNPDVGEKSSGYGDLGEFRRPKGSGDNGSWN